MKKKKGWFLWQSILMCLVIGVFAGCGHEKNKEEKNEQQSYEDEWVEAELYDAKESSASADLERGTQRKEAESSADNGSQEAEKEVSIEYEEESAGAAIEILQPEESAEAAAEVSQWEESVQQGEGNPQEEGVGEEENSERSETLQPYYLTEADKSQVLVQLAELGAQYGLTYHPDIMEGETWDSPTPIYEEELIFGREHVMNAMLEYTEGAFVLMQMENCQGFALSIKERPNTLSDAYYEVYVYWV